MPRAMWWCTQIRSPRPTLKPVRWCRGCLRFGVVWPCRMLTLETPVDSRPSMPTTDAGEDFMAAGCVEVSRRPRSQFGFVAPLAVNAPSRISRGSSSLAKQVVWALTWLIAYRPLLGFSRVELPGYSWAGGGVQGGGRRAPSCWVSRCRVHAVGAYQGLGRCFPPLPVASRCFQVLPANDVEQALASSGIIPPRASSCQPPPASGGRTWSATSKPAFPSRSF